MSVWTLGITASLAIGVLVAPVPGLALPVKIILAMIVITIYNLRPSAGPGPLNLFFACALGSYLGTLDGIGWLAVVVTLLSGLLTTLLCQIHLIRDPHGTERRAVERAEAAVNAYLSIDPGVDPAVGQRSSGSRWAAHRALHRAVTMTNTAHYGTRVNETHRQLAHRLILLDGRMHAHEALLPMDQAQEEISAAQHRRAVRQSSLRYLVARERHQHTFGKQTALRVGFALALAGVMTTLVGTDHFYWSVLTAGVILHIGPGRSASVERALHRALGTMAGVGIVALLAMWAPPAPIELAIVILGAFGMNLFLAHHYALAIMCVTPMSLMITNVMSPGMLGGILVHDRIIETFIGAIAAVLATMIFSNRGPKVIVQDQLRTTARVIRQLIAHLQTGKGSAAQTAELTRELSFELDVTGLTAHRARADAPDLWNLGETEAQLVDLGYDVLVAVQGPSPNARALRARLEAMTLPPRR